MDNHKIVPMDGEPSKPWQLWRVNQKGEQITKVVEGDTRDELAKHERRLDWRYQIFHKRRPIP
jgi:hypothetical protein